MNVKEYMKNLGVGLLALIVTINFVMLGWLCFVFPVHAGCVFMGLVILMIVLPLVGSHIRDALWTRRMTRRCSPQHGPRA